MINISIIICTYNRSRLLKKCLDSLLPQMCEEIEIIVIDNNSSDETADVSKAYTTKYQNIRYVFEKNIGLSHARNRGINESKADWILYLDDDAIAFPDLVERAFYLVNTGDFDCVGGMYYGYFEGEKPKWLSSDYGTKKLYSSSLSACPYYVPSGGIVLYKKFTLHKLKGFSPKYGITGTEINIGEETELQMRMQKTSCKIFFDPELKVYHLVKINGLTVKQILKKSLLFGKISKLTSGQSILISFLKLLFTTTLLFLWCSIKSIYQVSFKKDYYYQNLVLNIFEPVFYHFGKTFG